MAHPFDGPGRGLSVWPLDEPLLEPEHEILETQIHALDTVAEVGDEDPVLIPARAQEEVDKLFNRNTLPHVRMGIADDKVIYINSLGQRVRLDKRGGMFQCDLDGVRNMRKSSRPEGMEPEVWNILRVNRAKIAQKEAKEAAKPQEMASHPAPNAGGASFPAGCCKDHGVSASEASSLADLSDVESEKAMQVLEYERVEGDPEQEESQEQRIIRQTQEREGKEINSCRIRELLDTIRVMREFNFFWIRELLESLRTVTLVVTVNTHNLP